MNIRLAAKSVALWLALPLCGVTGCRTQPRPPLCEYVQAPSLPEARDVWVGVNYYAGWWPSTPGMLNKWHYYDNDRNWLEDFPERTPLLGLYNDQQTMDREIIAASQHGVDFFMMLWYPWSGTMETNRYQSPKLNDALTYFMNSPEAYRMRFCIEVCNHPPFVISTLDFWKECAEVWIEAMKHPCYLRIGGRPVIKIHAAGQLWEESGSTVDGVRERIQYLRRRADEAGLGELVICGGAPGPMVWDNHWVKEVFDFTGDYMDIPTFFPKHLQTPYPYDWLSYFLIQLRGGHQFDEIPYMPVIAAGWDPTPWKYPVETRPPYKLPTKQEWIRELRRVAEDLHTRPQMGIPLPDGSRQKAFTIYAWNEFGEGGYVAPTTGTGWMYLEGISEVFGVKKR